MATPRRTARESPSPTDKEGQRDAAATSVAQLRTLAADTAVSPSGKALSDGLLLSVKGHPLPEIVHLLATALLHQQRSTEDAVSAADAANRQLQASVAQCESFAQRVSTDLELERRPFSLRGPSSSSSSPLGTLAEVLRHAVGDAQRASRAVCVAAAAALVGKNQRTYLTQRLHQWKDQAERRVQASTAGSEAAKAVLAVYYLKWRSFAVVLRRLQRARERHVRAVAYRARNTLLRTYWHTWMAVTRSTKAEASRLRAYQTRLAATWCLHGPVATYRRRSFFERWRSWTVTRAAPPPVTANPEIDREALHATFDVWRRWVQRRQVSRLCPRLSRVLAAQNGRVLLLHRFRLWARAVAESRRRERLAVLAADAHMRRLTALARRYFHALRFHRREQQFQRTMRSVEGSLAVLATRLSEVERSAGLVGGVEGRAAPLMVGIAPPCVSTGLSTDERRFAAATAAATDPVAGAASEAWSPESERELLSRVEELLSRSV